MADRPGGTTTTREGRSWRQLQTIPKRHQQEKKSESSPTPDSRRPPDSKLTIPPKRPMTGIHKVVIYKDKPPDEVDHHEWP